MAQYYDHSLIRDIDVFDHAYLPEYFNHRDAQLQELAFLIEPALLGGSPENAILRGPSGTGKTTAVRRIFTEIEKTTQKIIPVCINCRKSHTLIAIYHCIARRVLGYPSPSRYLEDIQNGIVTHLRDEDVTLLVCLDDADYLIATDTYNILLYQLLRLYEGWDGVRGAGVFTVTSNLHLDLHAEADSAVRAVFHPTEIDFMPYTTAEIREILGYRVQQGLYPGVMPATVLDLTARLTADAQDIRMGIDLIRAAAMRAGKKGQSRITRQNVLDVVSGVKSPVLAARAAALSPGELSLLYQLAEQSLAGGGMMASSLFEEAQEYMAIGKTTYHARLRKLADAAIIDLIRTRKGHEVSLRYTSEDIFSACARVGGFTL